MKPRERKAFLIVGAPRSGKSFFANKLARLASTKGWSLIYNVIRPTDFNEAEEINFLDVSEHLLLIPDKKQKAVFKANPELNFFTQRSNEVFRIADFNRFALGKMLKCQKIDSSEEELLWHSFLNYLACGLIVLDDCRETFRHGLQKKMVALLGRLNHAGNKSNDKRFHGYGVDVALIFHAIDKVNQEIYDYINTLVLFRTNRKPDAAKFNNEYLYSAICWAYETLNNSPNYYSCHIDLRENNGKITVSLFDENLNFKKQKSF